MTATQSFLVPPIAPIISASAYASSTFDGPTGTGAYLGGPTVQKEHHQFPGAPGTFSAYNASVQNMQAYSFHTVRARPPLPHPAALAREAAACLPSAPPTQVPAQTA